MAPVDEDRLLRTDTGLRAGPARSSSWRAGTFTVREAAHARDGAEHP
ncbi:MAG: hypothetical protein ACTHXO_05845 [Actinomycetaceae bacterium]